jgi:hypothetical protein
VLETIFQLFLAESQGTGKGITWERMLLILPTAILAILEREEYVVLGP